MNLVMKTGRDQSYTASPTGLARVLGCRSNAPAKFAAVVRGGWHCAGELRSIDPRLDHETTNRNVIASCFRSEENAEDIPHL